jgi:hypothetical protein
MFGLKTYFGTGALAAVATVSDWKSTLAIGIGSFAAWLAHATLGDKRIEAVSERTARKVLAEHMATCPAHKKEGSYA